MMTIHAAKPLFAWDCLEDSPSLKTVRELLAALPDGKLLQSLRTARGKGRNDYPVSVLWGVVVLRVALRHVTTEAVLAELRRNEGLRRLIGIESEAGVPKPWNISRFEDVLGQEPHRTLLKEVFNGLIARLGACPSIAFSRRHSNNPVTLGIRSPDLARFYDEQDLSRMGPRPNLHVSALASGLAA
jgi:hypothetical protein